MPSHARVSRELAYYNGIELKTVHPSSSHMLGSCHIIEIPPHAHYYSEEHLKIIPSCRDHKRFSMARTTRTHVSSFKGENLVSIENRH